MIKYFNWLIDQTVNIKSHKGHGLNKARSGAQVRQGMYQNIHNAKAGSEDLPSAQSLIFKRPGRKLLLLDYIPHREESSTIFLLMASL